MIRNTIVIAFAPVSIRSLIDYFTAVCSVRAPRSDFCSRSIHMYHRVLLLLTFVLLGNATVCGAVIEFTDKDEWFNAVGGVTTITFTGSAHGTPLIDQYLDRGVLFTNPTVYWYSDAGFPNDEWGAATYGPMRMTFTQPMNWMAVDHPNLIYIRLFVAGTMIYETQWPGFGGGGAGFFAGLVSPLPFDEVEILKEPFGSPWVFIDDLHFGMPLVPAPGALALLGLAALAMRRLRRT
jgi:hypothetical protein